jgi:hypothetical protein
VAASAVEAGSGERKRAGAVQEWGRGMQINNGMRFKVYLNTLVILCVFIAACSLNLAHTALSAQKQTEPFTLTPPQTKSPIQTPTFTETLKNKVTSVPTLENTLLEIPPWLRDPTQEVLMYRMLESDFTTQSTTIQYLNPKSGEKYTLEMPDSFMCWHDANHSVFVHNNHDYPDFITILDLESGSLIRIGPNDISADYSFKDWICDFSPISFRKDNYYLRIDAVKGAKTAVLVNSETGEIREITDPLDKVQDDIVFFSPDKQYIAIIQINENSSFSHGGMSNQVSLYRFSDLGLIVTEQDNVINSARFVPGSDEFVYLQGSKAFCVVPLSIAQRKCSSTQSSFYNGSLLVSSASDTLVLLQSENQNIFSSIPTTGNQISIYDLRTLELIMVLQDVDIHDMWFLSYSGELIFMRGWEDGTPCIVNVMNKTKKCIHEIPNRFPGSHFVLEEGQSDKTYLVFLYWNYKQNILTGGLCFYGLQAGTFNCPMDGTPIPKNTAITEYSFSPNKDFIAFIYEDSPPYSDSAGLFPGLAVIGVDGKNFSDLGLSNAPHAGGLQLVTAWRPVSQIEKNP